MTTKQQHYIPREFALASNKNRTKEVARNEVLSVDTCPECKQPMRILSVNGHSAFCCVEDRIVMPQLG